MNDSKRKSSTNNGTVEQIMRNMTSDMCNSDGQYIQLGFTPQQTPQDSWTMTNPMASSPPYTVPGYIQQQSIQQSCLEHFNHPNQGIPATVPHYKYHYESSNHVNYNHCEQDLMCPSGFKYIPNNIHVSDCNYMHTENMIRANNGNNIAFVQPQENPMQNRNPLIENLVGNWTPNTSGTYSPFGNTSRFNATNLFDQVQEIESHPVQPIDSHCIEKHIEIKGAEEMHNFQFHSSRDTKKPRIVAEVKPMRPSYSDVLLKSAPIAPTMKHGNKSEVKEGKMKKETKKNAKNELKMQKSNNILNRSNTSNEINKDVLNDKSSNKANEKNFKDGKPSVNNLNRKWASLDNVADGYTRDFKNDLNDGNRKTKQKLENKHSSGKATHKKMIKIENNDTDSGSSKPDLSSLNNKSIGRKSGTKVIGRPKNHDSNVSNNTERPQGKRSQRVRKKENPVPFGIVGQMIIEYSAWWKYIAKFFIWLFHLVADIFSLSVHLCKDMCSNCYTWVAVNFIIVWESLVGICKNNKFITLIYGKFKKEPEKRSSFQQNGLQNNINMPATGEEAMKRLLACKGKDPYSILGVTPVCTDPDIKNYYKKQAKLVHPDKNQQPGAEEAFKILVHAFNMIGEPERRAAYDRGVAESAQAEQAMTELTELLVQLQQKVEAAANTIRCSACGSRHKRIKVDRPIYAARNCISCKIHHAAREGDIWAEAKCFGFLWCYFACMEGGVYDITEWAGCQKESLKHLKPDSHNVQYRIALGKQANNTSSTKRQNNMSYLRNSDKNAADLNNLFNNFYGQNADGSQTTTRRKNKKPK